MIAMRQFVMMGAVAAVTVSGSSRAWAEHFRLQLTIESPHGSAEASTDPDDRPDTYHPTTILDVEQGEPLVFQFVMTNVYPHGIRKKTGIHYWIRRQADDATPQTIDTSAPSGDDDDAATVDVKAVPLNGHFLVNFKPQGMVGVRQNLRLHDSGTYLVRVQSEHSNSDHEHFSQMILRVH